MEKMILQEGKPPIKGRNEVTPIFIKKEIEVNENGEGNTINNQN